MPVHFEPALRQFPLEQKIAIKATIVIVKRRFSTVWRLPIIVKPPLCSRKQFQNHDSVSAASTAMAATGQTSAAVPKAIVRRVAAFEAIRVFAPLETPRIR